MSHAAGAGPDAVDAPPGRGGVLPGFPVGGVHDPAAVGAALQVGTVEAGVDAVEQELSALTEDSRRLCEHPVEVFDVGRRP